MSSSNSGQLGKIQNLGKLEEIYFSEGEAGVQKLLSRATSSNQFKPELLA